MKLKTILILLVIFLILIIKSQNIFASHCSDIFNFDEKNNQQQKHKTISEQVNEFLQTLSIPAKLEKPFEELIHEHINYFTDSPDNFIVFKKRLSKFGSKIFASLNPEWFETSNKLSRYILFLMIAKGGFKKLLWDKSPEAREKLRYSGADPSQLINLFSASKVFNILQKLLKQELLGKTEFLDQTLEFYTGYSLQQLLENEELFKIFTDEIVDVLRKAIEKRIKSLSRTPSDENKIKIEKLEETLELLNDDKYKELSFSINKGQLDVFKSGALTKDCTASGKSNDWAMGAWIGTFENIEIHVKFEQKFALKMIIIIGENETGLVGWIHAIEFSPAITNEKSTSELKDLVEVILGYSLTYVAQHLKSVGIKSLFLTNFSNYSKLEQILNIGYKQKIIPLKHERIEKVDFKLLTPIKSALRFAAENPNAHLSKEKIYLQGIDESTTFDYQDYPDIHHSAKISTIKIGQNSYINPERFYTSVWNLDDKVIDRKRQAAEKNIKLLPVIAKQSANQFEEISDTLADILYNITSIEENEADTIKNPKYIQTLNELLQVLNQLHINDPKIQDLIAQIPSIVNAIQKQHEQIFLLTQSTLNLQTQLPTLKAMHNKQEYAKTVAQLKRLNQILHSTLNSQSQLLDKLYAVSKELLGAMYSLTNQLDQLTYKDKIKEKIRLFFSEDEFQQEVISYLVSLGINIADAKSIAKNTNAVVRLIREAIAYSHLDQTSTPTIYTINGYEIDMK